jgi:uncharacterized membrane protein
MDIQAMTESFPHASRLSLGKRVGRHRPAHLAGVGLLTALMAVGYSAFSLIRFYTFKSASYDLVIFDEAVRSYAHFHAGISIIKGVHNGFGPHFSVLGDHFSPILAALAPLYWIFNGPQTLLVAQSVLFALAIPPLWIFTRRALGGGPKAAAAAYLVCLTYGLSWPLAAAAAFDFHEVAFAPALIALAFERFQAGRLRAALITLAVLLLVKEDMGLFVAGIGVCLAVSRPRVVRRQWLVAIGLVVVGVAYTMFATYVMIPAFGGRSDYYWAYGPLGNNVPQVVGHLISHPVSSLKLLVQPGVKLNTLAWLVAVFCFLPLLSPIVLVALPFLVERMLNSKFPNWWALQFQYNAYLVVVFACAAVAGSARLDRWTTRAWRYLGGRRGRAAGATAEPPADSAPADSAPVNSAPADSAAAEPAAPPTAEPPGASRPVPASRPPGLPAFQGAGTVALLCAIAMCVVTVYTLPRFDLGQALHRSFYQQTARTRAESAAAAVIPAGVTVEATDNVGPHLSRRDTVLLWDGEQGPLGSPWIVADVKHREFTFTSVHEEKARVKLLLTRGYRVVFRRDGYLVLHRAATGTSISTSKGAAG